MYYFNDILNINKVLSKKIKIKFAKNPIIMKILKRILILLITLPAFTGQCAAQQKFFEIDNPRIKIFLPPKGMENGKAIVACPGGGYEHLAQNHEGYYWAPFFNNMGFAYAVVEYRFPKGDRNIPITDVEKAFQVLKDSAEVWKIQPEKIGIMGSSAGGHLASAIATHPTSAIKPAFQILFYPVISLDPEVTHRGTRREFLGENPSAGLETEWSSDKKVTPDTPPAFIALCSDDKVVKPVNSIRYYTALQQNGVPVEMLVFPTGGHGWGYRSKFKQRDIMLNALSDWLKQL